MDTNFVFRRIGDCVIHHCVVPVVATDVEIGSLVFEYGNVGTYWIVYDHERFQIDLVFGYDGGTFSWNLVVPQLIRGCWIL